MRLTPILFALFAVATSARADVPSFVDDVLPIMTRLGCNQGACHGKNAGQNGFRLSLRAYAPEFDYGWIVREFSGRRVSFADPESSLLLTKPLGKAPHAGGTLLKAGSREHRVLLDWIKSGAPGMKPGEPSVQSLEIEPRHHNVNVGHSLPLTVTAHYSDGRNRDVTWLARFDSGDAGMATVDGNGIVRVIRNGETSVRAMFRGLVAVTTVTSPYDREIPAAAFAKRNNVIDEHVNNKLAALRIPPSADCGDAEFLRRAMLDTIGTLPTADEVRSFLADTRPDKRRRLIDSLFTRTEFVDFWTLQIADLLQNRKERDHDVRGVKGVRAMHAWIREQVAANRRWDEFVGDVLTATGSTTDHPQLGYFVVTVGEHHNAHQSEVVAAVAQTFLGTRIGCAQCHNHPLERYTQDDYYHFAAFFSRIKLQRKDSREGPTTLLVSTYDPNDKMHPVGVTQPRTGQFLAPRPLDGANLRVAPTDDPRRPLVGWITGPSNDAFRGTIVNRLWRHFMGVGLVEPVDDLRASNPPTNRPLYDALTLELVKGEYDLRHVMKVILNSRAYQRSAEPVAGNELDARFYSRFLVRRLPAEVLQDAISQATGVPQEYPGYPLGARAIQLPDPGINSPFLRMFGRSDRVTACACERSGDVTLPQLVHLQNSESVLSKIRAGDGRLAGLLKKTADDAAVIDELFLATLSRPPKQPEREAILTQRAATPDREEFFRDLLWALLNAKEFSFNH